MRNYGCGIMVATAHVVISMLCEGSVMQKTSRKQIAIARPLAVCSMQAKRAQQKSEHNLGKPNECHNDVLTPWSRRLCKRFLIVNGAGKLRTSPLACRWPTKNRSHRSPLVRKLQMQLPWGPQLARRVEWKCRMGCRMVPFDINVEWD